MSPDEDISHHHPALDSLFGDYIQLKNLPKGDLDWVGTHIWKDVVNLQGPAVGGEEVRNTGVCCLGWGGCYKDLVRRIGVLV